MFSDLLNGQPFAVKILEGHMAKARVAHAYLLTGPAREAKEALAVAFAAALNGPQSIQKVVSSGSRAVERIQAGNHPDVIFAGKDVKARSVKIEEVRKVLSAAALKPYEGKWKVFVMLDAQRLTTDASNALLKTLEEPPGRTVFLLITEHKENLLDTIPSRCFEIRLKPQAAALQESPPLKLSGEHWEDFFEEFQTVPREALRKSLDHWMHAVRNQLQKIAFEGDYSAAEARELLKALDVLLETREALDANVNQKLALTRLTLRFKRLHFARP